MPRSPLGRRLAVAALAATALSSLAVGPPPESVALASTPWQMHATDAPLGPISAELQAYGQGGHPAKYDLATIPAADAPSWTPAPDAATIGFGGHVASRLASWQCGAYLDFTYFQTTVDVPAGATVQSFMVKYGQLDDGARVTVFNSLYPEGFTAPNAFVYLGGGQSGDLSTYLAEGANRLVVTHLDDCGDGSFVNGVELQSAATSPAAVEEPPVEEPPVEEPEEDVDTDGDGVVDSQDAFPQDVTRTMSVFRCTRTITIADAKALGKHVVKGTPRKEHLTGTEGEDVIFGYGGNDTIRGLGGDDCILAGRGNDEVAAGTGADVVWGEGGSDWLRGERGADWLHGNSGSFSILDGGQGKDACGSWTKGDKVTACEAGVGSGPPSSAMPV